MANAAPRFQYGLSVKADINQRLQVQMDRLDCDSFADFVRKAIEQFEAMTDAAVSKRRTG
jgi:hypothetical protein